MWPEEKKCQEELKVVPEEKGCFFLKVRLDNGG